MNENWQRRRWPIYKEHGSTLRPARIEIHADHGHQSERLTLPLPMGVLFGITPWIGELYGGS